MPGPPNREAELLRLLGIAARAGTVVPGSERVREAARAGDLRFAIVAADTSGYRRDRLVPLLRGLGIPHIVAFDRDRIGHAVGRAPLGAVGVTEPRLALRLAEIAADGAASDEGV
jgi:ribosomal protein L7Ae-like RNA K-turn-binding protein